MLNGNETPEVIKYESVLTQLRAARDAREQASTAKRELVEALKQTDGYTSLEAVEVLAEGEVERLETTVREYALQQYANDGNKHPHPKVEIKSFKTFKVLDPISVRAWCLTDLPGALDVNLKKVEKYGKDFGAVPGTEISTEEKVQISREL